MSVLGTDDSGELFGLEVKTLQSFWKRTDRVGVTILQRRVQARIPVSALGLDNNGYLSGVEAKTLQALHERSHRSGASIAQRKVRARNPGRCLGCDDRGQLLRAQAKTFQAALALRVPPCDDVSDLLWTRPSPFRPFMNAATVAA